MSFNNGGTKEALFGGTKEALFKKQMQAVFSLQQLGPELLLLSKAAVMPNFITFSSIVVKSITTIVK